jgi:hypothetical protein
MSRFRIIGLLAAVILVMVVAAHAAGYVVILKSGHKIRCKEPMRIEGPNAILTLSTGTMTSYPLQLVDLVETERYNQLGLGDALEIEALSGAGEILATPTPRISLGDHATFDAGSGNRPGLGSTVSPTPLPTPGIEFRPNKYHDPRIEQAFAKIFDDKGLLIYRTSQGTIPQNFFVQTTTDSEREVFQALEIVAQAFVLIHGLHEELAPDAVELEMVQTSGKPAGTFRLTPELADELITGDTPTQTFYITNVIF